MNQAVNRAVNRVIPCLLLQDGRLVKTVRFKRPRYIGDPVNAVRIFNDKHVDEIVLLDIGAARAGAGPDVELIARIAGECFIPLCYGGGIRSLAQARAIVAAGVEKIAVNSMALDDPALLTELAQELGASSVVAGVDVMRDFRGRARVFHPARRRLTTLDPADHVAALVRAGAGEIFLNSVDRDGTGAGFDLELVRRVSAAVNVPVTVCGGAAGLHDVRAAVRSGASAVAAGSMFVLYGPHRAVLINYPAYDDVRELFAR
jgi:cyclase